MLGQSEPPSKNSMQIWLAVIGLIGTLCGAVIPNWDKLFPRESAAPPSTAPAPTTSAAPFTVAPAEINSDSALIPEASKEVQVQQMPTVGPSFDCTKATYRSERMVCSSPDLAVLDLAMANAYRDAAARVGTKGRKATLRNLQNRWLRHV